ncbi:MAG: hypothetical protein EB084_12785 [Proteobacteria bacterium]|nr:hypothetical protein [Pseudomonadota bacterium]
MAPGLHTPGRNHEAPAITKASVQASPFLVALIIATVLRVTVAALLPLTLNEPYYWEWARHPSLGYYDHPPLTAWLGTLFVPLGNSALVVRLPALLCATACALIVHRYARRATGDEQAAHWAAAAFVTAPYYTIMAVLAWPESTLLLTWAWTLLAWHEAVFAPPDASPARRWGHAGVALGACLLAKFTSFALAFGLGLFFVVAPRARRRWLATPWPWTALVIALLVYSPCLWWNATHGWQTFAFQATERTHETVHINLRQALNFVLETLGGLSPLIAVALVAATARAAREAFAPRADAAPESVAASAPPARDAQATSASAPDPEATRLALAASLPVLCAFFALVPFRNVQVYWTLCGYIGLFPLLGQWVAQRMATEDPRQWRRRIGWAVGIAFAPLLVATAGLAAPRILFGLGGRPQGSALTEMYAYPALPALLEAELSALPSPQTAFIAAEDHRLASHLSLLQARPVLMFGLGRRGLEYLNWESPEAMRGQSGLLVMRKPFDDGRQGLRERLSAAFDRVGDARPLPVEWNGRVAQTFYVVPCVGFHPERAQALIDPRAGTLTDTP